MFNFKIISKKRYAQDIEEALERGRLWGISDVVNLFMEKEKIYTGVANIRVKKDQSPFIHNCVFLDGYKFLSHKGKEVNLEKFRRSVVERDARSNKPLLGAGGE